MTLSLLNSVPIPVSNYLDIGTGPDDFFHITSVGSVISSILGLALIFGGLAFILYFALSAIRWLTSGGDKGVIEAARNRMTNAFIGLVLVAASWAVYLLVIYLLGLPIGTTGNGGPGPTPPPIPSSPPPTPPFTPPTPTPPPGPQHRECINFTCETVVGIGFNQCNTNIQCQISPTPTTIPCLPVTISNCATGSNCDDLCRANGCTGGCEYITFSTADEYLNASCSTSYGTCLTPMVDRGITCPPPGNATPDCTTCHCTR